jgi:hypothetical protein|tara:strand:- start:922 stop:1092 length:171 start_codon:yes stop_codon:yes gene_type:complete
MKTNVYIRVFVDDAWESLDMGDPRISIEKLEEFLGEKSLEWITSLAIVLIKGEQHG